MRLYLSTIILFFSVFCFGQDTTGQGGGVPTLATLEYVRIPLNVQTLNVNATNNAVTDYDSFGTPTLSQFTTVSGNKVSVPEGFYYIQLVVNYHFTNARYSCATELLIDGVSYSIADGSNYARAAESHNETGSTFIDIANVLSTIDLRFIQRSGGNGGTNTITGGWLILQKID